MNGDPVEAAKALIRSFGLAPPAAHSVYVQRRMSPEGAETVLKVHCNVNHPQHGEQATRIKDALPTNFLGFPVEYEDWPLDPREVLGVIGP